MTAALPLPTDIPTGPADRDMHHHVAVPKPVRDEAVDLDLPLAALCGYVSRPSDRAGRALRECCPTCRAALAISGIACRP